MFKSEIKKRIKISFADTEKKLHKFRYNFESLHREDIDSETKNVKNRKNDSKRFNLQKHCQIN